MTDEREAIDRRTLMGGAALAATAGVLSRAAPAVASIAGDGLPPLSLDGRVVTIDDPAYEEWRTGVVWQDRKPGRRPAIIVRPRTAQAVSDAIGYARKNDLKVAVKSSGHHVWANFLRDGGMLIDMWDFRRVTLDADGETAWIEPAVWSREVMVELARHGRAFPAAHCGSVGMGGFLLGGGVGLNWENWGGLSCYSVLGAEVVTADGRLRLVDDRGEPDLAWALRGAGNGFPGIVTRYKVRTYKAPAVLKASTYIFPILRTAEALAWVEALAAAGKLRKTETLTILGHSPAAGPDTPPERSKVCVVRLNVFADSAVEADAILGAVAADPGAAGAAMKIEREDWTFDQSFIGTLDPRGPLNYGHFSVDNIWTDRPREALTALAKTFVRAPSPACHVVISRIDAKMASANAAARVAGHYYVGIYGVGATAAEGDLSQQWLRGASAAIQPFASGRYINEIDPESDPAKIRGCYAAADWDRIAAVRRSYDPDRLFHDYFGLTAA